jgi:heat shock protein HslJ
MCDRLTVVRALLVLVIAAGVVACSDDGGAGDGSDVAAQVDGRELVVVAVTEAGAERELVEGTEIRLTFEAGQLGASAGCNSMGGPYAFDGAVLVVDGLATTDMACEPPLMAQDEWLAGVLSGRPEVSIDDNGVSLVDGSTAVLLVDREAVRPDAPLVGTVWVLDTIFEGGPDGAASSVPGGVEASVTFADDGTFAIDAGCNGIGGEYEQTGATTLVLAGTGSTLAGCPADVAAVEELMLDVFAPGQVEATVDDQRLTLTAGDAGLGFRAAP